jgi:hypothetical protein
VRSNRRQIRPIVVGESPDRAAIDVRDQCVAFAGFCSSVATSTSSTLSGRIDGGRPGGNKPSTPLINLVGRHPEILGDLFVGNTVLRAGQHNPRPQCQRLRRLSPTRPSHQLVTLVFGQHQLGVRPTRSRHPNVIPN